MLNDRNVKHLRGAPYHPMTQGNIDRWHQTLKKLILLENYFLPGDLEAQVAALRSSWMRLAVQETSAPFAARRMAGADPERFHRLADL
jgi:hypothetical protein